MNDKIQRNFNIYANTCAYTNIQIINTETKTVRDLHEIIESSMDKTRHI